MKTKYVIEVSGKEYGYDDMVHANIASNIIGVSPSTLRRYAAKRIIPIYKINKRTIRFLIRDLIEWTEERRIEAK